MEVMGSIPPVDTPLMSAGLDSIAVTEFVNILAKHFDRELPSTLLFDHPTINSMTSYIAETTEMPEYVATIAREAPPTPTRVIAAATPQDAPDRVFLASRRIHFALPGGCNDSTALKEIGLRAWTANSHWPVSRAV